MAWTTPRTWTSATLTAAQLNTDVRDDGDETAGFHAAAAGDVFYATGANAIADLSIGSAFDSLQTNSGATAPEWDVPMSTPMPPLFSGFWMPTALLNDGAASATWPTANEAIYIGFPVTETITVKRLAYPVGSATTGSYDVGLYDSTGTGGAPGARLASSGATAVGGSANTLRTIDIADQSLTPGLYYLAFVLSSTSGTVVSYTAVDTGTFYTKGFGCFWETSAGTLPATATPSRTASGSEVFPALKAYTFA